MSIQAYQISLELEVLLHKIHYCFDDKQEEIRHDPYSAVKKALSFYIADTPSMSNELINLLSDFDSLSGKTMDKIFESDEDKKLFLALVKKLTVFKNNN